MTYIFLRLFIFADILFDMIQIDPNLDHYISEHVTPDSDLLHQLLVETFQLTTQPHMISGEYQGRLLSLIAKIVNPKKILEIGTFTGYSALCLAEGLQTDGHLITIDVNDELAYIAQKYFDISDYKDQIDFRINNALDEMQHIEKDSIDLIFIDADKQSYLDYYEKSVELLKSGGVILIDNVLWYGKVYDEKISDEQTNTLRKLNDRVVQDSRVESVILPIRDGITLIRKK